MQVKLATDLGELKAGTVGEVTHGECNLPTDEEFHPFHIRRYGDLKLYRVKFDEVIRWVFSDEIVS